MNTAIDEETTRVLFSTKEVVRAIMVKKPEARDDDKILIAYCMKYFGAINRQGRFNMQRYREVMPAFETITRVRREIQNKDGVLLPTRVEVANARKIRQEVIRRYYEKNN